MRTNLEIIKAYGRYLENLKSENSPLFENYEKMYDYLRNKVEDKELSFLLSVDCIEKTLKEADKRNIRFKSTDVDWNKNRINRFFNFKKALDKASNRYEHDKDAFSVCFARMFKFIEEEPLPNMQLYMWSKYRESEDGLRLLTHNKTIVRELLACSSEQDIDKIIYGENSQAELETVLVAAQ